MTEWNSNPGKGLGPASPNWYPLGPHDLDLLVLSLPAQFLVSALGLGLWGDAGYLRSGCRTHPVPGRRREPIDLH